MILWGENLRDRKVKDQFHVSGLGNQSSHYSDKNIEKGFGGGGRIMSVLNLKVYGS